MKERYISRLHLLDASESDLRIYFEEFNQVVNPESGTAMKAGIRAVTEAIDCLTPQTVMLVNLM